MRHLFRRLRLSLKYRWRWVQLGVYYLRGSGFCLDHVTIAGQRIRLLFPDGERYVLEDELGRIYQDDCYGLRHPDLHPSVIVDVGANVGLFAIVARHLFPRARITCYEPNRDLEKSLGNHLERLQVPFHLEAVGRENKSVRLIFGINSLHSRCEAADSGVPQVCFQEVLTRAGGHINLLKLDCEGAEWESGEFEGSNTHCDQPVCLSDISERYSSRSCSRLGARRVEQESA